MRQTASRFENFYGAPLGRAAQTMVLRRLHSLWPHMVGLDVLGYGYSIPYLKNYQSKAHKLIYAMPSGHRAVENVTRRGNSSVLVHEHQLPFLPASFDRVFVSHGLEEAAQTLLVLAELWRVMKPEGRIVIAASNRAGLWARSDKTPFGAGRPFSGSQLSRALKKAGFVPLVRSGALYCPPVAKLSGPRMSAMFETFGETVWPAGGGIVLVEAVKRLYVGQNGATRKKILRPNFTGALGASGKIYQPKHIKAALQSDDT